MLRRSNRKPDSNNAGRNVTSSVTMLETNWLLVIEEISSPIASATSR